VYMTNENAYLQGCQCQCMHTMECMPCIDRPQLVCDSTQLICSDCKGIRTLLLIATNDRLVLFMSNDYCMLCMQVAEDNRINQKVLRMMLQTNCAELTVVSDGQQAVDAYHKANTRSICFTYIIVPYDCSCLLLLYLPFLLPLLVTAITATAADYTINAFAIAIAAATVTMQLQADPQLDVLILDVHMPKVRIMCNILNISS
jgi:CheY-like chemotaxis protein